MPTGRLRPLLVALLGLALLAGCAESPEERLKGAWEAASAGDVPGFALYFTPASGELVRGVDGVKERTRAQLQYLNDVFEILPPGDVTRVRERGRLAVVSVEPRGGPYDVQLVKERGQWRIDAFTLPALWEPLRQEDTLW